MALAPAAGGFKKYDPKTGGFGGAEGTSWSPPGSARPGFATPGYRPIPQAPNLDLSGLFKGLGNWGGGGGDWGGRWRPPEAPKGLPEELGNPKDLTERNLTAARDIGSSMLKEAQTGQTLRLGPGATFPGAANRISAQTLQNFNKGALDAQKQEYDQKVAAYNAATGRYEAGTQAWSAGINAQVAMERARLDAQIAAMNAMLGLYSPLLSGLFNMYGNLGSSFSSTPSFG